MDCGVRDVSTMRRALTIVVIVASGVVCAALEPSLVAPSTDARQAPTRSGEQLYRAACAACHGPDGRGVPTSIVGFDTPLPDFTDCRFASREAQADWHAIVDRGGPVRAFDAMMPAFGDALTDAEIEAVLRYVKGLCASDTWPQGELNLPRPLVTEKAYPEDEVVLTATVETDGPDAVSNVLLYERRFGARHQLEVELPFVAREQGRAWAGGIGDIALATKHVLFHTLRQGRILSVGVEAILPTGDRDAGFGNGTVIIEPFVAFGQILPAESFLHLHGGIELPADTARAGREAFWRLAIGRTFAERRFGRAWSPMVEVVGARGLAAGERVHWDVVPQVQVSLSRRQHVLANLGVRLPVSDTDARHPQVMAYLLWDWFDGGLFQGW
jgi:mono/diheme cytochrome c family protein